MCRFRSVLGLQGNMQCVGIGVMGKCVEVGRVLAVWAS